jgi:predicted metal-dependent peptidase
MISNAVRPTGSHLAYLARCRALALEKMPYLAAILLRLDVWNAPGLGTYAVDDRWRLYIDFEHCIASESVQLGAESLLHECGHVLGEHAKLARELGIDTPQDAKVWNLAADAAWDDDLVAAGCQTVAQHMVTPAKIGAPDYQTPQHYYGLLKKKMRVAPRGGTGKGQSQGQQGAPGGQVQQPGPYRGCGSGAGMTPAPCEFGADDESGQPVGLVEAHSILVQAAQDIVKSRGTAPASMVEEAETTLRPSPTPWQRLLSSHLRAAYAWAAGQVDQSYQRRSRRRDNAVLRPLGGGEGRRVVKPGWMAPKPAIEAIVDTSGSMSAAEVAVCRNEIEGIARKIGCRGEGLMVTEVDAKVQSSQTYHNQRALGGIHGRGGTDMRVGIEHALNRRKRPDVIVILTDAATPWPADRTPVPLIAVIVGDHREDPPAWIKTVRVPAGAERAA